VRHDQKCLNDVEKLASLLIGRVSGWVVAQDPELPACAPDVVLELTTDMSINALRGIVEGIEDSHVMYETLAYAESYTGER
jgi:hypothetical protein